MRSVKTNLFGKEIKLYDSIKELPMDRDNEFQKLLLRDMGIGSTIDSVHAHHSNISQYIKANRITDAARELINLESNYYYMIQGINIKSYCFAVMVHSIGGEEFNDFTDLGVKEIVKKIEKSGLKASQVSDIIEDIKKKLMESYDPIFRINTAILETEMSIQN